MRADRGAAICMPCAPKHLCPVLLGGGARERDGGNLWIADGEHCCTSYRVLINGIGQSLDESIPYTKVLMICAPLWAVAVGLSWSPCLQRPRSHGPGRRCRDLGLKTAERPEMHRSRPVLRINAALAGSIRWHCARKAMTPQIPRTNVDGPGGNGIVRLVVRVAHLHGSSAHLQDETSVHHIQNSHTLMATSVLMQRLQGLQHATSGPYQPVDAVLAADTVLQKHTDMHAQNRCVLIA